MTELNSTDNGIEPQPSIAERRDLETRPFAGAETQKVPSELRPDPELRVLGLPITRLIELVIGVVAVPLLAYLAFTVTRLDTTVSDANLPQLAKDVSTTKDRVGRIFGAFPEMRMRIAEERADMPVTLALLAFRRSLDQARIIHLVNLESGRSMAFDVLHRKRLRRN